MGLLLCIETHNVSMALSIQYIPLPNSKPLKKLEHGTLSPVSVSSCGFASCLMGLRIFGVLGNNLTVK